MTALSDFHSPWRSAPFGESRRTMTVRLTKSDPARGAGQLLRLLHESQGRLFQALRKSEEEPYVRNPQVKAAVEYLIDIETKGAVGAGTTAQTGWASELAPTPGIFSETYTAWQGRSITGRVLANARREDWRVPTPKETGLGATASWRGESLGAVVMKSATGTFTIGYREAVILMAASKEMMRFSPIGEAALSRWVTEAVVAFTDTQFLDPTITATSTRPASITNGAQPVTSSGSTAANIATDLASMVELMQILSDGDAWVWALRPTTYYAIAAKFAGAGTPITPGQLLGINVVLGSKSPRQIALIDASNIAWASDGQIVVDISNDASVEMSDAPGQSGAAGTGASLVSFWQSNLVGVRATLGLNWQTIRYASGSPTVSAGATYMSVAY
jgi:hypothetical protein